MGSCPTADPWLHAELLSVFDESHEVRGQKRLRGVFRFKCLPTLPRDLVVWKNAISFFPGSLHSREPTNDVINILLKYTVNFEGFFLWDFS